MRILRRWIQLRRWRDRGYRRFGRQLPVCMAKRDAGRLPNYSPEWSSLQVVCRFETPGLVFAVAKTAVRSGRTQLCNSLAKPLPLSIFVSCSFRIERGVALVLSSALAR
jgi:hypothetical protein